MVQTQIGAKISCRDGWCGTLKRWAADPGTGKTTHLVIEATPLFPYDAVVPIEHVIATGHQVIFLDLTLVQLEDYRECG